MLIGKNSTLTVVGNNGNLRIYVDGIEVVNTNTGTGFSFSSLILGRFAYFNGDISAHIIRSQALTTSQVAAEHAVLREMYPEIPSVTIDTLTVATSNLEMVANTAGTVITQATTDTDWQTGAARWCYYLNNTTTGATYGKIYNKLARNVIITSPPSGWHVSTYSELNMLKNNAANNLKVEGTDYWNTANGINKNGFTALGGGLRNTDATFTGLKDSTAFWAADVDSVLIIRDNGTMDFIHAANELGAYIRLIAD